jgi:transcriptional regulator
MYRPSYQREDDPTQLWAMVERHSFASVICADDDGRLVSTLVPFIRRSDKLFCHMARANPQGLLAADGRPVLCQFLGPHTYISPTLYEQPGEAPTWNYVQVQIEARLRELDREGARVVVGETVREHERGRANPIGPEWMAARIDTLIPGVRAFEVLVEEITGRFKLSQNRPAQDRRNIVDALRQGGDDQRAIAVLMDELPTE